MIEIIIRRVNIFQCAVTSPVDKKWRIQKFFNEIFNEVYGTNDISLRKFNKSLIKLIQDI